MRLLNTGLLATLLWITGTEAVYGIDYHAKASYFNFDSDGESVYVFALNAVANGDVYFHMSGPVTHTWIGIGFGDQMKDSFMIIAYPSADGRNTTISTRLGSGHTEPVWTPGFEIHKIYNDTYAPHANIVTEHGAGTVIAHAMCRNCTQWATGFLDTKSTQQPMIFALGPSKHFGSDDVEASLPRHSVFGKFTVDMTVATNYSGWYGRVPAPNIPDFQFPPDDTSFASFGTTVAVDVTKMSDPLPGAHGALMCVAFVFIFPLGATVMRFLRRTLWHAAIQSIGVLLVVGGLGVAVQVSRQYNKSKNFSSGHQVLGLIIFAALFVQLGLGLVHHSIYVRTKKPTPLGKAHFILGPSIMLLGLINGGIGFNFAGYSNLTLPYGIVVAAIALVYLGVTGCLLFCRSRRRYKPEPEGYQYPQFGHEGYTDYEMPRQPAYGEQPPAPYEPLTPGFAPSFWGPITPSTDSPYTPTDAHMPITPKTWKKEEVTTWARGPPKEDFQ